MCVPHACTATLLSLPADAHLLPFLLTIKDLLQMLPVLLNLLLLQSGPYLSLYAFAHACCSHGYAVTLRATKKESLHISCAPFFCEETEGNRQLEAHHALAL